VKVPYEKDIFEQKYRTVNERVPYTKFRTYCDILPTTVYEEESRTRVVPVPKICYNEIPVYNFVRGENLTDYVWADAYPKASDNLEVPVQWLQESTFKENTNPNVEIYPPYVETHPEPPSIYQIVPRYEPEPDVNTHMIEVHDRAPGVQPPCYAYTVQPVQGSQESHHVPVWELAPVINNPEPALYTNSYEPYHQQLVGKWIETKNSIPTQYNVNNDVILEAQKHEVAHIDGNYHVGQIAVVQNPKDGDCVDVEQLSFLPQP